MFQTKEDRIALADLMSDNIGDLLDFLEIDYTDNGDYYAFVCPIHEGADNPHGCTMTVFGEWKGAWKCWTRGCEKEHTHSILGFVRAVLSVRKDKEVSFNEAINFCKDFLNVSGNDIKDRAKDIPSILQKYQQKTKQNKQKILNIPREEIRKSLKIPSKYYISRGYTKEVLDKFDVGNCDSKGKQMNGRIVAPVYDENFEYLGCVGRTTKEEHNGYKWINSKYFNSGSHLYGYWLAKEKIREKKTVVLVEGQGDVWRLHEAGIENCVGIFGSSLSDTQSRIIQTSGAFNVVILTDNDEGGEKARRSIKEKCGTLFNIVEPKFSAKDIGEMTVQQIQNEIKPQLEGKYV